MEEAREGEHWGFGDHLPAESSFVYTPVVYGGRTYTRRQQHWRRPMLPAYPPPPPSPGLDHPDGSEEESTSGEGEGEFQGPVSIYEYGSAFGGRRQQQQGKRGRVTASSEAAILRLLHEAAPTACCSDCCAICLEDFADAAAADPLPLRAMPNCSHIFHKHCILKWLRLNAVCPVCRRQLPLSLSTEEEDDDEEEEEQARRRSTRRRSAYDDWLALVAYHARERQRQD